MVAHSTTVLTLRLSINLQLLASTSGVVWVLCYWMLLKNAHWKPVLAKSPVTHLSKSLYSVACNAPTV